MNAQNEVSVITRNSTLHWFLQIPGSPVCKLDGLLQMPRITSAEVKMFTHLFFTMKISCFKRHLYRRSQSICSFLMLQMFFAVLAQMYFVFDLANSILFAPTKCHYTLGPDLLQPKKSVEKFYLVEVGWFSIECNFMKTSFGGWVSYQKIFLWCLLLRCCAWWYMAKVAGVHDSRWPIYCVAPIRRSHIGCQLSSLKCEQNFWIAKSCNIPTILFRYPFGIPAVGNFLHILELLRTVISPTYSWLWL